MSPTIYEPKAFQLGLMLGLGLGAGIGIGVFYLIISAFEWLGIAWWSDRLHQRLAWFLVRCELAWEVIRRKEEV